MEYEEYRRKPNVVVLVHYVNAWQGNKEKSDHGLAVSVQGENPSMYRAEVYGKRIHTRSIEQRVVLESRNYTN